ncbi:MAG: C25 family cysteine peptidase [Planctomycetota bacterium]|jgi:hypothetical protein
MSNPHSSPRRSCRRRGALAVALTALLGSTALAAPPPAVQIDLLQNTPERIVLCYEIGAFTEAPVVIDGAVHWQIELGKECPDLVAGAPELPSINRSLIIPDTARMEVRVLEADFYEVPRKIAPSKGSILRTVDPATVPYTFGPAYEKDAFHPGTVAALREPYVMRDHRGVTLDVHPFQYNPITDTLRVYTTITVEVVHVGPGTVNLLTDEAPRTLSLAFHQTYTSHFLNYVPEERYDPIDEDGGLLIICHGAWMSNMEPFVAHKMSMGMPVTLVNVSTIPGGNSAPAIKNYITSRYLLGNVAFVLLVGDSGEIATPIVGGDACDPTYGMLVGSDSYPEVMVGRFSAQTAAHVDTQVQRTIAYETMPATEEAWFWRGTGIASNEGPGDDGEYDDEHVGFIRDDLLASGWTEVDEFYQPSAYASQVTNALNAGRGIINYTGHGSTTSWATTGFNNGDVNALVNDGMLPFICSVACVNGNFDGPTCFAEAWLRATNGSAPTGAIAVYMSSINQYWDEPMCAQDEVVDRLIVADYVCFGACCFAGSCQMMDEYGSSGADMFETWHIFGDPSVRIVPPPAPLPCPADLDESGDVGFSDILQLIGAWGPCAGCPQDLDGSGDVGFSDILVVIGTWGECP